MSSLQRILTDLHRRGGSDLVLKEGRPPLMRIHGQLLPSEYPVQSREVLWKNLQAVLDEEHARRLSAERELDLSFEVAGVARFRVNVFHQRGRVGAVVRAIPLEVPTVDALGLPPVLKDVVQHKEGMILVTGPTGSGKSTTLAAMVEQINATRPVHVITIEDPIEFVYADKQATVTQRGIGEDTHDTQRALRAALRQNPDVIMAGEMRDRETMELALHAAQTGHLVLSTLHTNDARQSVTRILDAFPPDARPALLRSLSLGLRAVVSQRLIPRADGAGRVAALEVMIVSPGIRQLIEKGAVDEMTKAIQSSAAYYRMQSFNQSLHDLVTRRLITPEVALEHSLAPGDLQLMLRGHQRGGGGASSSDSLEPVAPEAGPAPAAPAPSSSGPLPAGPSPSGPPPSRPPGAAAWAPGARRPPPRPSGRMGTPPAQRAELKRPKMDRGFDFS